MTDPRTRATRFLAYCWQRRCSSPAWSADGRLVAVAVTTGAVPEPNGTYRDVVQLAILDAAGALVRLLPLLTASDQSPAWSPDGHRLAFVGLVSVTFPGGHYELPPDSGVFTVRTDGTDLVRRSDNQDVGSVAWSSRGQLAFGSGRPSGTHLAGPGQESRRLIRGLGDVDWSPGGTRIVATDSPQFGVSSPNLAIFDRHGRRTRVLNLSHQPSGRTGLQVTSVSGPAWSPDGRRIAFVTRGPGKVATWIVSVDAADGTRAERLFGRTRMANELEWTYSTPAWRPVAIGLDG